MVVRNTMAELIHAKFLSWRHLHLLEDPFFAKADVESAVNIHKSRGNPRNRGISNFQSWLDRTSMPLGELNYAVLNSLKNGTSYYVHRHTDKPRRPLLFWQSNEPKSNSFFGISGSWQVHPYVAPALRNKLRILLSRIEPPKPVVLRKVTAEQVVQKNGDEKPVKQNLLTIRKLALKLLDIETEYGVEIAKYQASLIGYEGVCDLAEIDHPQNDPNLMPSKYMLIPGASDAGLRKNGNLNNWPSSLHPDSPKRISVENLNRFLVLSGHHSDGYSFWQTKDHKESDELSKLKDEGLMEEPGVVWADEDNSFGFDDGLKSSMLSYLSSVDQQGDVRASTHTVEEGETLSSIANDYEVPSWKILWEENKEGIDNPDLIYPGQQINIPDLFDTEIEAWIKEFDNGESAWAGSNHYKFPANLFSMSLTDSEKKEMRRVEGLSFEAYINSPKHLIYSLELNGADQLSVLMPDTDEFGFWLPGFDALSLEDKNLDMRTPSSSDEEPEDQESPMAVGLSKNTLRFEEVEEI